MEAADGTETSDFTEALLTAVVLVVGVDLYGAARELGRLRTVRTLRRAGCFPALRGNGSGLLPSGEEYLARSASFSRPPAQT